MRVKDKISKNLWLKTPFANLVRYVPSGIYFARIRVRSKLIRRSLKTNKLAVAKLRLWEAFRDPKDGKVKLDGENVTEFPKLALLEQDRAYQLNNNQ